MPQLAVNAGIDPSIKPLSHLPLEKTAPFVSTAVSRRLGANFGAADADHQGRKIGTMVVGSGPAGANAVLIRRRFGWEGALRWEVVA
jgi:hypothetical protein